MRLNLGMAAALCLATSSLFAQTDTAKLHDAKMKMIREAVNFYSLDAKLSKKPVNCDAEEVEGLKACAAGMEGVGSKIEKWNRVRVSEESALEALAKTIISDVTVGAEKQHRLKIPGYKDFESRVKELGDTKAEQVSIPSEENQATPPTPAVSPESTSVPQSAGAANEPATVAVEQSSPAAGPIWKDPFVLSCIALVLSLIAVALALMAKNSKSRRRSGDSRETPPVFSESGAETYQTHTNIAALQRQVANLERELGTINTMIEDAERRLNEKVRVLESQQTSELPGIAHPAVTHAPLSRKWAKNVDGGGFEMDALSSEPDSKMIYEITQTGPQTATFKVSETREAQLFALTNPQNYLREGCNYTSQPSSNSQIKTEVPGTLELQGRKWRIINPAQITFS